MVQKLACQFPASTLVMKILSFFANLHQQIKIVEVELAK
jgi:hypothetical protein